MLDEPQRPHYPRIMQVGRCFVQRKIDGKLKHLILQRAGHEKHNAGKWEAPGGKLEYWQNFADAQKLETLQETGLNVEIVNELVCTIQRDLESGRPYLVKFAIARVIEDGRVLKINPDEHKAASWVSYEQMLDHDLTDEVRSAALMSKKELLAAKT